MSDHPEIDCPCCGGKILLDAAMLLKGSRFSCSNEYCDAVISLSSESHDVTKNALDKLNEIKKVDSI